MLYAASSGPQKPRSPTRIDRKDRKPLQRSASACCTARRKKGRWSSPQEQTKLTPLKGILKRASRRALGRWGPGASVASRSELWGCQTWATRSHRPTCADPSLRVCHRVIEFPSCSWALTNPEAPSEAQLAATEVGSGAAAAVHADLQAAERALEVAKRPNPQQYKAGHVAAQKS